MIPYSHLLESRVARSLCLCLLAFLTTSAVLVRRAFLFSPAGQTFTVTNTNDNGSGSLRNAINAANGTTVQHLGIDMLRWNHIRPVSNSSHSRLELSGSRHQTASQDWIQLAPTGTPPSPRGFHGASSVYDASNNRMIVFGGRVSSNNNTNDVWILTNANGLGGTPQWINLIPDGAGGSPPARSGHSAAYNPTSNRMIIFGGCNGACLPVLNDVWVLANANGLGGAPTWSRLFPSGGPPASRTRNAAVYDSAANRMIIFAGQDGGGFGCSTFGDTWILSNANGLGGTPAWIQLSPTGGPPPGQYSSSAVYDPANNRTIIFGGSGLVNSTCQDTNGVSVLTNANGFGGTPAWTNLIPEGTIGSPHVRSFHVAAYDSAGNRMVIFGGGSGGYFNDSWVLANANGLGGSASWTQLSPTGGPPSARSSHAAVFDTATKRLTIFGGNDDTGFLNDTWTLSNANAGFKINGRVVDNSGNALGGIALSLNGSANTTTDNNGNYSFGNVAAGGSYTVTPSSNVYSFSPANQTFNTLDVDRIANFVGTLSIVSITGKVTDSNNAGINNVTLALTKNGVAAGTTQTDPLGNYGFGNLAVGASYVVTPTGSFTPLSQTLNNLRVNAAANFKSAPSIPSQCSTPSFVAAANYAVGSGADSIAVGDFNGDGKLDLAVANQRSNDISILLGNGAGSFTGSSNPVVGAFPNSVAVADFNGDGKLDLAVGYLVSNSVSILLGNGGGSFLGPTNFSAGAASGFVAVDDFNGDGKPDLAVANFAQSGSVSILLGTGTGSFGNPTSFAVGPNPSSIASGDFNADGRLDLAVTSSTTNNLSILFGTGTGSFSAATNLNLGSQASSVVVGDFNSDGKPDLALAYYNFSSVSILLGTGTGNFSGATNFPSPSFQNSIAVSDFNGDGKLDLALANNPNTASVLLGSGNGMFSAVTSFPAGAQPSSIALGDFNGDGKPDLATANFNSGNPSNVSVLLNNTTGCNAQTSIAISGQTIDANNKSLSNVTLTLSGPVSRVVQSDAAGNYSFANLTPGGDYSVTVQSPYFVFAPSGAGFFNLSSSQTFNFVAAQVAVPAAPPPPSDTFDGATRDTTKWNLGTQTEPASAFDPRVTTAQVNGQLVIKPQAQAVGMHYNGYVATNSFDITGGNVKVEMSKAATGGADSIFAIGTDTDNFFRFMVHSAGVATSLAPTVKGLDGLERPLDTTTNQLVIQVKINGVLNSISVPYDPAAHRFMRFRHEAATASAPFGAIRFETSPDNSNFTLQQRVVLTAPLNPVLTELSAGTSNPPKPSEASFGELTYGSSGFQFSAGTYSVGETEGSALITVNRVGDTTNAASVEYATVDGTAKEGRKYTAAAGRLDFAPGQTSKTFFVLIIDNAIAEGNQTLSLVLRNPNGGGLSGRGLALLTIVDDDTLNGANQVDNAQFFVRQHYFDFLNRLPDADGLAFWTSQITTCGTNQACIDDKRNNVSASFFLSIEFQQTGYLVERMYKAAYGDATGSSFIGGTHTLPVPIVRFDEFLPDTQRIGQGLVVGQTGWETILENNKQAFASEFVQRSRFSTAFATTLAPPQFVDALFAKAGVTPLATDRNAVIAEFGSATNTSDLAARGRALRRVAENSTLATNEFNRAFVLMQYFGYLRRNPNDPPEATLDHSGYDFWLNKLNFFNGNYLQAEMVKAFITSSEYRQRFGT